MRVRLNIGLPGSGKSKLLAFQLKQLAKKQRRQRVILIDPTEDDYNFGGFGVKCWTAGGFHRLLICENLSEFNIRLITSDSMVMNHALKTAFGLRETVVVIDELGVFCETKAGTKIKPPWLDEASTRGRHRLVQLLATCQRPTQIHNSFLHLVNEMNIFQMEAEEDLKKIRWKLRDRSRVAEVMNLKPLDFFSCKGQDVVFNFVPES